MGCAVIRIVPEWNVKKKNKEGELWNRKIRIVPEWNVKLIPDHPFC